MNEKVDTREGLFTVSDKILREKEMLIVSINSYCTRNTFIIVASNTWCQVGVRRSPGDQYQADFGAVIPLSTWSPWIEEYYVLWSQPLDKTCASFLSNMFLSPHSTLFARFKSSISQAKIFIFSKDYELEHLVNDQPYSSELQWTTHTSMLQTVFFLRPIHSPESTPRPFIFSGICYYPMWE